MHSMAALWRLARIVRAAAFQTMCRSDGVRYALVLLRTAQMRTFSVGHPPMTATTISNRCLPVPRTPVWGGLSGSTTAQPGRGERSSSLRCLQPRPCSPLRHLPICCGLSSEGEPYLVIVPIPTFHSSGRTHRMRLDSLDIRRQVSTHVCTSRNVNVCKQPERTRYSRRCWRSGYLVCIWALVMAIGRAVDF